MGWLAGLVIFFVLTFVFGLVEDWFDRLLGIRREKMDNISDRVAISGCAWITGLVVIGTALWLAGLYGIRLLIQLATRLG